MKAHDVVIVGYGGLAKEIAQYISDINRDAKVWDLLGFCAEQGALIGREIGEYKIVMCDDDLSYNSDSLAVILGVGFPNVIAKTALRFAGNSSLSFPNIIHPHSYRSSHIRMERGNIVCPGTIMSVDVEIGSNNVFNWNCTIGHDAKIGSFNVFNPSCNISGSTKIGSRILIGTGAQILQGLSICDDVIIGAGAVVTKDITEPGTYVGMPARKLK